jgi:hypothetical protein
MDWLMGFISQKKIPLADPGVVTKIFGASPSLIVQISQAGMSDLPFPPKLERPEELEGGDEEEREGDGEGREGRKGRDREREDEGKGKEKEGEGRVVGRGGRGRARVRGGRRPTISESLRWLHVTGINSDFTIKFSGESESRDFFVHKYVLQKWQFFSSIFLKSEKEVRHSSEVSYTTSLLSSLPPPSLCSFFPATAIPIPLLHLPSSLLIHIDARVLVRQAH